jgi:hypothetical protein
VKNALTTLLIRKQIKIHSPSPTNLNLYQVRDYKQRERDTYFMIQRCLFRNGTVTVTVRQVVACEAEKYSTSNYKVQIVLVSELLKQKEKNGSNFAICDMWNGRREMFCMFERLLGNVK